MNHRQQSPATGPVRAGGPRAYTVAQAVEALGAIQPGHRVFMGPAAGEPRILAQALTQRILHLPGLEILSFPLGATCPYLKVPGNFTVKSFLPTVVAGAVKQTDYIPAHFSEIPRLIRERIVPLDVALVQLSPPDETGHCSLGVAVDFTRLAIETAPMVIAEINDQMPFTLGNTLIPLSALDVVIHTSYPLASLPERATGPVETAIARNVAELVPDGATIQLGIGGLAEEIASALVHHRNLGIHSGNVPTAVIDLIEAGAVTGVCKEIDQGQVVVGSILGTERLYRYVNRNPLFRLETTEYTHDPAILHRFRSFVAINSALQADLTGQVNAETIHGHQVSGTGGQVDFMRAAAYSPGGRSILALPATAGKDQDVSRIVPLIEGGDVVTTPRSDVQYVVTEFGIADLRGKTIPERVQQMLGVAHPRFRKGLRRQAHVMGLIL